MQKPAGMSSPNRASFNTRQFSTISSDFMPLGTQAVSGPWLPPQMTTTPQWNGGQGYAQRMPHTLRKVCHNLKANGKLVKGADDGCR